MKPCSKKPCALAHIGLLATFQPSIPSLEQEFVDMAKAQCTNVTLESVCVSEAMAALTAGDADQHDRLIAEAAPRLAHCDVVMLAQFSMARARPAVQQVLGNKVLTSPDSAVAKLKAVLTASSYHRRDDPVWRTPPHRAGLE